MQYIDENSLFVTGGNLRDVQFDRCLANSFLNATGASIAPKRSPSTITVGLSGSSAMNIVSASQDVGAVINGLIADDTTIFIFSGTYKVSVPIELKGVSRCCIKGEDRQRTILRCDAGVSGFDMADTLANYTDNIVRDLSLVHSTGQTGNAGTVGINIARHGSATFENLYIRWFATGMKFADRVFYSRSINVKVQNCSTYSVHITKGANDRCNENAFIACVFLGDDSSASDFCDTHLYLESGNSNGFVECTFENWVTQAILFGPGVGGIYAEYNRIVGGRLESNQGAGTPKYAVVFDDASTGNYVLDPYVSGGDVNTNAMVNYNASVGNWVSLNSFKGSEIRLERDTGTAGGFINYIRSGPGDASSLLKLDDTYAPSGSPITLEINTARPTGNFFSCKRGGNTYLSCTTTGDLTVPDTSRFLVTGLTGATKAYFENNNAASVDATLDLNFEPDTATDDAFFRIFKETNSSGSCNMSLFEPNTSNVQHKFECKTGGTSYLNGLLDGKLAIGAASSTSAGSRVYDCLISGNRIGFVSPALLTGNAACDIDQETADEALVAYYGASAGSGTATVSSWLTGAALDGYLKIKVNGVAKYLAYYTAPSGP